MSAGLVIEVRGHPKPQGSKRHVGNGVMVESCKGLRPWRTDVKLTAVEARGAAPTLDGPLVARVVFTVAKPSAAPKRRRTWPATKPDLPKLLRAIEDALSDAGLWRDDARVVEYQRLAKVYHGEDPEALDSPGVRIVVAPVVEVAP